MIIYPTPENILNSLTQNILIFSKIGENYLLSSKIRYDNHKKYDKYDLIKSFEEFINKLDVEIILKPKKIDEFYKNKILGGTSAGYYSFETDRITINSSAIVYYEFLDYYSLLFHEIMHWTEHSTRTNSNYKIWFYDRDFIKEKKEIIAELGVGMLFAHFNIDFNVSRHINSNIFYLENKLKIIEECYKYALEAVNYLHLQIENYKQ